LADAYAPLSPERTPARFEVVSAEAVYGAGYDDTQQRIPDIRKAQQLLGWKPQKCLAETLPSVVRDYADRYGARIAAERPASLKRLASSG